jgi:RNA-directed DNA polymerase
MIMAHKVSRHENLYPQVYDWDNLLLAYRKASKGKRGNPAVAAFEYHLEDNLIRLREELVTKVYQPSPYHSFYIHEPKRRLISAGLFRDRVVHHALCNIMEPIFERGFISDSYASRPAQNRFCYSAMAFIGVAKLVSRHWLGW